MSTHFGEARRRPLKALLEPGAGRGHRWFRWLTRFALEDGSGCWRSHSPPCFISASRRVTSIMGFLQAEPFIQFNVLFHVKLSAHVLHADVMYVEIVAGGDARMRSNKLSWRLARAKALTTTSASGNSARIREATSLDTCSDFWKVTLRDIPTETSAK